MMYVLSVLSTTVIIALLPSAHVIKGERGYSDYYINECYVYNLHILVDSMLHLQLLYCEVCYGTAL